MLIVTMNENAGAPHVADGAAGHPLRLGKGESILQRVILLFRLYYRRICRRVSHARGPCTSSLDIAVCTSSI